MKLQLTKTKTIELSFGKGKGGGKKSKSADIVGVELFSGDARGVPAVRLSRKKSVWHLQAADFVKGPPGELPERWEDVSHRSTWELPAPFQAPHAAIAANSRFSLFSQSTADTILQDMARGIPAGDAAAAADPGKKRLSLRRNDQSPAPAPAEGGAAPKSLPAPGIPTATNGMRFTVKPTAEDGRSLEAALPEFQVLWLSRLLPEGHRPTTSSIQPTEAALMASVLAQPFFAEVGGTALVMFMLPSRVIFSGYKGGLPVLWRHCPVGGGHVAMKNAVKRGLGLDDEMVKSVLEDTLIDPRGALEPFLGPIFGELELSRAYLTGKHGMNIDRVFMMGLPVGAAHVCAFARDSFKIEMSQPGVFDGLQLPAKGEVAQDWAYLPALGAALAASGVTE